MNNDGNPLSIFELPPSNFAGFNGESDCSGHHLRDTWAASGGAAWQPGCAHAPPQILKSPHIYCYLLLLYNNTMCFLTFEPPEVYISVHPLHSFLFFFVG
jgi:hypothetical protein